MASYSADLPKATNEKERRRNIENASKQSSELNNPCLKEQRLSLKCLADNNYDKEICETAFLNYKSCREFWRLVVRERRSKGINPSLPPPEEREQLKAEFLAKLHGRAKT